MVEWSEGMIGGVTKANQPTMKDRKGNIQVSTSKSSRTGG